MTLVCALVPLLLASPPPLDAGPPSPTVMLVLVQRRELLAQLGQTPRGPKRSAIKGQVSKVPLGQRVFLGILLDGYELPPSRRVDVTADLVITDPTGRVVYERASAGVARTFNPRIEVALALPPAVPLLFGATDPDGEYLAKVSVLDQVRGARWEGTLRFAVGP